MLAREYIRMMVYKNKIIYIDTASLMDVEELCQFIHISKDILLSENRRIVVPQAVCLELIRLLGSRKQEKQGKAMQVLELLNDYQDIFDIRNNDLNEDEIYSTFADAEILAELIRNKKNCGQLLITNDRALSQDAYELNNQGSCIGHQIMVCFINRYGELRKCYCTNTVSEEREKKSESIQAVREYDNSEQILTDELQRNTNEPNRANSSKQSDDPSAWNVLIPIGTFFLGSLFCKYGKTATQIIISHILGNCKTQITTPCNKT